MNPYFLRLLRQPIHLSPPRVRILTGLILLSLLGRQPSSAQNTPPPPVPQAAAAEAAASPVAAGESPAEEASLDPLRPEELKRYGIDRYQKIIDKSPFAFKIVRPVDEAAVSFAADLALAGFTIDVGKGITYASIVDKKSNKRSVIRTDKPNAEGIQLVQLNRGLTLLESSVMARKGAEEAQIKADKQIIERKAVVNAAVMGQPSQPAGNNRGGQQGNNLNLQVNRPANVQQQINSNLQQPNQPGAAPAPGAPPQANLPPGAVPSGGAVQTVGDQSVQAAQPQAQPGRPGQAPGRRRVILPPAAQN